MEQSVSRPRICVVRLSHFPGDPRLEREMSALVQAGFAVDLLCIKRASERGRESLGGVEVYRLPLHHRRAGKFRYVLEYSLSFLLAFLAVSALHWRKRYRVVQVNTLPDFLVFTALVPRILGARVLLDMHEITPELYASKFGLAMSNWQVRFMMLIEQMSARFAHAVIAVSDPTREALASRGTPAEKIHVVMNVADDRLFSPQRSQAVRALNNHEFHLMSHGTVVERYGFQTAIEAVALLRDRIPGLRLSILGEGEYLPSLQRLAAGLGAQDTVRFYGYVPHSEIPSHISQCHGGLVPNLKDCFTDLVLPTKLMEYVAMGKPVITSRTKAVEEYFDESMVLFFEPGRAGGLAERILELYQQEGKRTQLARNAEEFIRRFHWGVVSGQYVSLVQRLAGGGHV